MYVCTNCGQEYIKWQGQCSACMEWNTLKEFKPAKSKSGSKSKTSGNIIEVNTIESENKSSSKSHERIITKSSELNTVLGGGIIRGSVILLSGEPGIGKSTLSLQLGSWVDDTILYVSGEETVGQIGQRAKRLGVSGDKMMVLSDNNLEDIIETAKKIKPSLLIIDSISVIRSDEMNSVAGSITQVKYASEQLTHFAKEYNITTAIIAHVTKDGNVAGPKTLEHMVDVVVYFEGNKYDDLRMLRAQKNRFGATSEVGIYTMKETGLHDIENPAKEFLSDNEPAIGSSLSITMEGSRAFIVQCESLTTYTKFGYPKRSSSGIQSNKLDILTAVLGKYTGVKLDSSDVYINLARGMKIYEPGIDLALAAAIVSSKNNIYLPRDILFIGEISLTGKVQKVMQLEKRIKEAAKLGFKKIYIPKTKSIEENTDIEIVQLQNITDLVRHLGKYK